MLKLEAVPRRDRVMTLRTPRRRISPRTKQRYQAIKNFLRRTLGSSSQPNINTNTSVSVSVSALKQKINGIEHQLNTVSKHCRDLAYFEYNIDPNTISSVATDISNNDNTRKDSYKVNLTEPKTEVLYKNLQDKKICCNLSSSISKSRISDADNVAERNSENKMTNQNYAYYIEKGRRKHTRRNSLDPIKETEQLFHNHRHHYDDENYMAEPEKFYSRNGPRFLNHHRDVKCSEVSRRKKQRKKADDFVGISSKRNDIHIGMQERYGDDRSKNPHRNKHERPEVDQDFIADIIKRQYRPVTLLGRRESEFSQFSAPICRDQEFSIRKIVQEGSELCSCCNDERKRHINSRYMCTNDLSDIRSICDTRLYSSRKYKNHLKRRKLFEDYNDSTMYDVIPVKEKSSPKSRRKFMEDNLHMLSNDKYKEVPPSPRTHRPRLNLQAQLKIEDDDDDDLPIRKQLRNRNLDSIHKVNRSDISSELFIHNKNERGLQKSQTPNTPKLNNQDITATLRSLQSPGVTNNDTTLNTQFTDMSADKTDKTLSEIKDILQCFLQEMKKETSQSEKVNTVQPNDTQQQLNNRNAIPNGGCSCYSNNNTFSQCMPPFVQSFTNPCCYPILPMCPMNCMQNGLVVQSPSYTCTACAKNSKERTCGTNETKNKNDSSEVTTSETQKLLKEIHKLISENPNYLQKQRTSTNNPRENKKYDENKILTSRSIGGSSKASKHDAKVGTQMKYYSKSCEAIGSKVNTHHTTNASYSDTILEKGSSEEDTNAQSSESDYSSESTVIFKKKDNKFSKILRSIGLRKKKKNDVIEELSESDSYTELKKTQTRPPFQQHIMSYNMYEQQYFHPPHAAAYPHHLAHQPQCQLPICNHPPYYSPRTYSPTCESQKIKDPHRKISSHPREQAIRSQCASPQHIPMTPYPNCYDPHYANISPQVPLCLKEIEVKSIGTQSVRKMSFLQKFTNKMQVPAQKVKEPSQTQSSTQISMDKGKSLFDWKKIQAKTMQDRTDPLKFSYKTSKKLAEGDIKMRNAMLKKLFYKRNPFSPRNLLVRTILGKDRSSFGEPPKMYKPSMFL